MNDTPDNTNAPLSRLEERLQSWIENRLAGFFENQISPAGILRRIARALEASTHVRHGRLIIPDTYTIQLNPDDYQNLYRNFPDVEQQILAQLKRLVQDLNLYPGTHLQIILIEDAQITGHAITIKPAYAEQNPEGTRQITPVQVTPDYPDGAELILPDGRHIALDRAVMNLGRSADNHIIIDDRRVSRKHCQIRLRFGNYVLYDRQSKGGTCVNNARIQEHRLTKGDVLSLAGVQIIYVDDAEEQPKDEPHTPPLGNMTSKGDTRSLPVFDDGDPTL